MHTALPCQQSKKPAPQAFLAGTAWPSLHHILQPGGPLELELVTLCLFLSSQRHFQFKMPSSITLLCCHAKSKQHEAPSLPQSFGLHAQLGTKESIIALELPSQCLSHKWWTCTCTGTSVAAHRLLLQLSALQLTCRLFTHTT